jgi:hypothetical protein
VKRLDKRIHDAFDKIHADDRLKDRTAAFLHKAMAKPHRRKPRLPRVAIACSLALLFVAGAISYQQYSLPSVYIDIDVNPSIELAVNRFGRVIDTLPYNEEGRAILQGVSLRNMDYEEASATLIDIMAARGYLVQDGLVSVTVQSGDKQRENRILQKLQENIAATLATHHTDADTEIYSVTGEIHEAARAHHMTPAKYLAAIELQKANPAATFEESEDHSITEIRNLTKEHHAAEQPDTHEGEGKESENDSTGDPPATPKHEKESASDDHEKNASNTKSESSDHDKKSDKKAKNTEQKKDNNKPATPAPAAPSEGSHHEEEHEDDEA